MRERYNLSFYDLFAAVKNIDPIDAAAQTAASVTTLLDNQCYASHIYVSLILLNLCNVGFYRQYPGVGQRGAHLAANHVFTYTRLMPK